MHETIPADVDAATRPLRRRGALRSSAGGSIGNLIEWYDFPAPQSWN